VAVGWSGVTTGGAWEAEWPRMLPLSPPSGARWLDLAMMVVGARRGGAASGRVDGGAWEWRTCA
jgi:hypothetical protein